MKKRIRTYSGTRSNEISARELENRAVAREAAAEGIVLLKNDGILPLEEGQRVALFGGGAVATVKGGTGSGDVNEREVVSIYQGFVDAGILLANRAWLERYGEIYRAARLAWRDAILEEFRRTEGARLLNIYSAHIFRMPAGDPMRECDFDGVKTAFYVISRTAGEAADRFCEAGDYYLTDQEKAELQYISAHCEQVAVILNTGGVIDLQEIRKLPNLKALISVSQPGMEGGHALADVLTGKVTPCGKLTDTWAVRYEDYPGAMTFSHMNGNVDREYYKEGIYVGYRYFDAFGQETAYPFGYGLSYTTFSIDAQELTAADGQAALTVRVTNTGRRFAGREVVQLYASCPQSGSTKELRRLCAFAKTGLLQPGESVQLTLNVDAKLLASFDEGRSAWMLERGWYGLWLGASSRDVKLCGVLEVRECAVVERAAHICPLQEELEEIVRPGERALAWEQEWHALAGKECAPVVAFELPDCNSLCSGTEKNGVQNRALEISDRRGAGSVPEMSGELQSAHRLAARRAADIVSQLTEDELISMVIGEVSRGQNQALGAAGIMVPGTAGETSSVLDEKYGIPGVPMADGPAGVRLMKSYEADRRTGDVYSEGILGTLEGGMFSSGMKHPGTDTYYQYCTAFPVGTLLAQTLDTELLEKVGRAVARELQEFGIAWWLAPGMNIHRNPLCGRNFEYYSEDPVLSGKMAAAVTRGVQSAPGVGTTIKHFACNNQEDNRMGSDSIVSERALREIYLRGFEIAVKESQPMAVMTSYNLINGVHTANSRDLCTQTARNEWGFEGIIMTDWTTTSVRGGSIPWKCVQAGNDLIMPGSAADSGSIRQALADGLLSRRELEHCVTRLLTVILQTLVFENPAPYGER